LTRATDELPSSAPVHATVRACRLVDQANTAHHLKQERVVIGAHPSADLVIDDSALSSFHAEVRITDGQPTVRDLGSKNGTFVDQVRVIEAPLHDGAMLTLGRTLLRFHVGAKNIQLPLSKRTRFGRLVGISVPMRAAFELLERAAASDSTVLLLGETGTGKDLAAESIHQESARRDGPFVVVDCGAITPGVLESELFGHERGAFTGADATRIGALEAASGGTLFLDEIGELSLDLQPKLLRALEHRELQRIGSTKRIAIDVRIIAATNRNLREEVNARRFRADLYFRLAVVVATLPPLRERPLDLPILVEAILDDLGAAAAPLRSAEVMRELLRHAWPGNVRELRNHLETRVVHHEPPPAAAEQPTIDISKPLRMVREEHLRFVERRYLEQLLAHHGNNVSAAARAAGIDRVHFHRLLKKHR
jgi:two-component system, NtrC family, response regulator GlrR